MSKTSIEIYHLEEDLISLGDIPLECLQVSLEHYYPHKNYLVKRESFKGFVFHLDILQIPELISKKNIEQSLEKKKKIVDLANEKLVERLDKIVFEEALITQIKNNVNKRLGLSTLLDAIVVHHIFKIAELDSIFEVVFTRNETDYTSNYKIKIQSMFNTFFN